MYLTNVLAPAMESKSSAVANPATISHRGVVGLAFTISVWPSKTNEMMVFEINTIELQRNSKRTDTFNVHKL